MADTQSTVALNIGSQRISMAVFEPNKGGGLLLKAYDASSILADPATEAARIPQTRLAVSELAERLGVQKSKVRYAISGQSVFTRFVKLPALGEDNIEQLVTFEAQQHVPFPINEVVWDYQLLEGEGEKEVALVAIKSDALDEINEAVNEADVSTAEVDVAPMALYNSFRFNYPDLSEPVLIIDIGAKTTNLLYLEGRRFFTRSVAIGGVSLTTAIAKEYGVSFSEAENQKISNGLVTLGGGHTEQLDETVAALGMVLRNALTRLPAEIARTTNYFRSQHGGSAPKRVFLAGGGSNLPYLKEFFEEKLNLPAEFFNPLQRVTIGKKVDVERLSREAHLMGELVGLGVRGIGKSVVNIDLVPESVVQERAEERRKPYLIAAAAILLVGFALWGLLYNITSNEAAKRLTELEETSESLDQYETPISRLIQREEQAREVVDQYVGSQEARIYWADVLTELKTRFAHDAVWLVSFDPLVGYNPVPAAEGDAPATTSDGISVVNPTFATIAYGNSAMAALPTAPVEEERRPRRRRAAAKAPPAPLVNAVRIRGLWRDNPKSYNVVYQLLKNLRTGENSMFDFTVEANREEMELPDERIIRQIQTARSEGEFAWPFEMVIPLAEPLPLR